ncbi:unnamed protein product [Polarella glacialis]|uniref:Uncharacterized protein n=1 Tax=Polarella glacialis TaxID=89957 RepID=A0A813I684_POLGL|nr:unnamed protein product [Polarella glacialis]
MALPKIWSPHQDLWQRSGDAYSRKRCLCLRWLPWEEQCRCSEPLPDLPARSNSLPDLKRAAKQRAVWTRELCAVKGFSGHPLHQRLKASNVRAAVSRACASGERGALEVALRSARVQLGLEDPVVKRLQKLKSAAEHCSRTCRQVLNQLSLHSLPQAMEEIGSQVTCAGKLGLGDDLWKDPFLNLASATAFAWKEHGLAVEGLREKLGKGPGAFCVAWAHLALQDSPAKAAFGTVVTQELPPMTDAGVQIARALASTEELPAAPEGIYDERALRMIRISIMLGHLDSQNLENVLLRRCSDGRNSLQAAAELPAVFCALWNVLAGEVLVIGRDLQQELAETFLRRHRAEPKEPPSLIRVWNPTPDLLLLHLATLRVAELLQLEPAHLCVTAQRDGGFSVRLFPEAGQPSAQRAQELVGGSVEQRPPPKELSEEKWQRGAQCVKEVFAFPGRSRAAKEAVEFGKQTLVEIKLRLQEATESLANSTTWLFALHTRLANLKETGVPEIEATYQRLSKEENVLSTKAMRGDEEAEEELDDAKARTKRALKDLKDVRNQVIQLEAEVAETKAGLVDAGTLLQDAEAALAAAEAALAAATADAAEVATRYDTVMRTPVAQYA